jgi:hypothetical protein
MYQEAAASVLLVDVEGHVLPGLVCAAVTSQR